MSCYKSHMELPSVNLIYDKCPICERMGRSLACSYCDKQHIQAFLVLQQGKIHSNESKLPCLMFLSHDLQEKLTNFQTFMSDFKKFKLKFSSSIKEFSSTVKSKLESDINNHKTCTSNMRLVLKNQQLEILKKKKMLQEIQKASAVTQKRIARLLEKKVKLKEYIKTKKVYIDGVKQKSISARKNLQNQRKDHVQLLRQFIFPIKEIGEDNICTSSGEYTVAKGSGDKEKTPMQEELDEARRLSFVNGRWVDQQVGSSDVLQISVATSAACAPSDGNYSAYVLWLEENHGLFASELPMSGASMSTSVEVGMHPPLKRSVFRISAALSHAAQMLMIIRKILVVHLPNKINYKLFCNPAVSPRAFVNSVKLLNCNILSLCLQQGVDGSALHPLHTLRNLQILLERLLSDDERLNLFIPDVSVLSSMEETLGLADVSDDDIDSDVEDFEWQAIESGDCEKMELPSPPAYMSTNTQSSFQPSGLVTSAFNWARGWWGPANE